MEELRTLIQKLLKRVPDYAGSDCFVDNSVTYINDSLQYDIDCSHYDDKYIVHLGISEKNPYRFLNAFYIPVTEKEYMEIKWKIEEWNDYLKQKCINEFTTFVNGFSNGSMDELLDV